MSRIFRYILKNDTGMAPCVDDGLVTLAVCKPKIRGSAGIGDWVLGFYPKPEPRGLLAWAGRVARRLNVGDYETEYRGRSDAIYRQTACGGWERLKPEYHASDKQFRKDVSAPVMVFDKAATWYFGDSPHQLPKELQHLAAAGQGHRVNGVHDGDPAHLEAWLRSIAAPGPHGKPRHGPVPPSVAAVTA